MCDTMVALGNATRDGSVIFAKNSDREPNEAHQLVMMPAADYPQGASVQCTYISLPQSAHTHAVLLAKPFWIWGAEMGANEHGVVIGNEALFTRTPGGKEPGLIGMDFLRLALERGADAPSALQVIIQLLEEHGQSGNCGFLHPFYYQNSYLIADRKEAWVLETAGRQWAAVRVKDIRSISNAITIGSEWDGASAELVPFAVDKGWCKSRADFHFARCYSDPLVTRFSGARGRQSCTQAALEGQRGQITPRLVMNLLRDHGGVKAGDWRPDSALTGTQVCMHAGYGPVRINQSVGSQVSQLSEAGDTHWLTGTSAPCTSVFKPVWMDTGLPEMGPVPTGQADDLSLFWRHERLHRAVLSDPGTRLSSFQSARDEMETCWMAGADGCREAGAIDRRALSERCFQEADQALAEWLKQVQGVPARRGTAIYYRSAWKGFNREAKLNLKN